MTPHRLRECLTLIRWRSSTLANAMVVPMSRVEGWLDGRDDIPTKVASWLEALCFTHEAAEHMKPAIVGEQWAAAPPEISRLEHVPVYSYNLLRQLGQGPVALATLFGTEDEGAVFYLVSRGLAERSGSDLVISSVGRQIGEVT